MPAAQIGATALTAASSGTTPVAGNLPAGITSGQLLLAWVGMGSAVTRPTPDRWRVIGTAVSGGTLRSYLFGSGTADDAFSLDRSGGATHCGIGITRVFDWFGDIDLGLDFGVRTITNNGSATPTAVTGDPGGFTGINFGPVSPAWGSDDQLCIAGIANEPGSVASPAGYPQVYFADNSGVTQNLQVYARQVTTATEDPPLLGSLGANITAFFVIVRPALLAGFGAGGTLAATVAAGSLSAIASAFVGGATLGDIVAGGALGLQPGVLTSQPLRTNNGTLLASVALDYVDVYLEASGVFVGRFTGLSTNGDGVFTVTSPLITPGTAYKLDWRAAAGQRRMPVATAA
jgi:hypothetical protein